MAEETKTPAAGEQQQEQPAAKNYTQADIDSVAANAGKMAVEKLLKDAGIDPAGDYAGGLKSYKAWQDGQKTDLEKLTDQTATLEKDKAAALTENDSLKKQLAAIGKGIPTERAGKYVRLAEAYMTDKIDFPAALDLALKDFPVKPAGAPGTGGNPPAAATGTKSALPKGVQIF